MQKLLRHSNYGETENPHTVQPLVGGQTGPEETTVAPQV